MEILNNHFKYLYCKVDKAIICYIISCLICVAGLASAQEYKRVISTTAISQQIAVVRQVYSNFTTCIYFIASSL